MEKFFVLKTVTDRVLAEKICDTLENSSIPVMLEHIILSEGESSASGFRILVPLEHTQNALRLAENAEGIFYTARQPRTGFSRVN